MNKWLVSLFLGAAAVGIGIAYAQVVPSPGPPTAIACAYNTTPVTLANGQAGWVQCNNQGSLQVNATVNASVSGFAPAGTFATLTATGSSASVALPAGAVVLFQNTGTTAVSCTLGIGSATAVASQNVIQPASWLAMTVGSNTFGACIDQTGSASNVVALSGGAGLPTGAGGGTSSGGGGGGAVTVADGADVAQGLTTDSASAVGGIGTLSAKLRLMTTQLDTISSAVQGAIPTQAATVNIGAVGISQTTDGTTNLVRLSAETTKVIGTVNIAASQGIQVNAAATGGATTTSFVAANSNNATALKASAGTVYGVQLSGIGATPAWVKFYDKATTPTCQSDTIVAQFMIPANSTAANGGGNNSAFVVGKAFTTGISYCVVTGIAANDNTSVAAATFVVNIDWK